MTDRPYSADADSEILGEGMNGFPPKRRNRQWGLIIAVDFALKRSLCARLQLLLQ